MGRTLNFFDFSGGRRQSSTNDLKAPRNCSDVSNETSTGHMSSNINRQEKQFTYEMTKASTAKKKAVGMPMKTLIAQEMSRKETDSKCRTPSVIARLMGLDALPTESLLTNQTKEAENHTKKKQSWKQQQQSKSTVDVKDSLQKAKDLERKRSQHISSAKSQQCAVDKPDGEMVPQDNHYLYTSHKMQQQKFKKDFETWQASKFRDNPVSIETEKLNMQTVGNQMLKYEKLNEETRALVRKNFMDAKRLATDVNLQRSKEFLDAVEILQSNKDAFLEFLEQPNALLAKQVRDSEFTSQSQSQLKQITVLKSSNAIRTSQWLKEDTNREKSLKKGVPNEKHLRKQKGQRDIGEKKETREVWGLPPSRPASVCSLPDQYKQSHSNGRNSSGSLPTRIVVLKPGPGRVQNVQSDSTPSYSPQYQTCTKDPKEMEKTKTQDYLQGVRIRLEMEIRKNSKDKSKNIKKDVEKQFGSEPIYHREIASDIARHLRQTLTRDAMNDAPAEVLTSLTDSSGNVSRSRSENGYEDVDQEVYTPVSKLSWDSSDRFSLPSPSVSAPSDSSESTVNREAKRRLLERWKSTHRNVEEQQQRVSSTLAEMLALPERKNQVSGSKSLKENGKAIMSAEECEVYEMLKLERKNKKSVRHEGAAEWEGSLVQRNEDDDGNVSSRNFQRSRSVPVSSTTYDGGIIEMQWKAPILDARNTHAIDYDRSSSSLSASSINSKNDKSISKGKVSSIKCNFLMRGKWSNNKKSNSLDFMQSSPNLQLQSDKELSVSMEQRAEETYQYKEIMGSFSSLAQQESCEVMRDAPEEITETDDCSVGAISENSGLDEDGYKQPIFESSVKDPIPFERQEMLSCIGAGYNTGAISSVVQPEFPSPCSPIKKLPVFENHVPETNIDKGEHPSPVSVLDCPFQEDFSSPNEFKEISSNLHELRLQLHLLKCEGSERPVQRSENLLHGDNLHFKDNKIGDEDVVRENNCNTPSEAETPQSKIIFSAIGKFDIESLKMDGIWCSEEQLPDLLYVRDVLVASGFIGDCNTIFARWHSPSNPLDPHLFGKLEDLYKDTTQSERNFSDFEFAEVGASMGIKAHRSKSERRLLYDCTNEVLLEILGSFLNRHSWVRPTKMNLKPMAAGKQLLKETWARICHHLYPQAEVRYTLENLVTNDLSRETVWMELKGDMEITGHELERAIFADLIEGILCDLVS
ncbi:uncharacterized protein LOC131057394 [Cryptomeria japonica]|uniref:uncharacterized protein LOC131057394 n=1 Tax=Cryptomeria japonica TaxID=3369 RepID=UPI0027DA2E15|nr:uncharacterized protein LOC131057394 [Cryptomeria japonica]